MALTTGETGTETIIALAGDALGRPMSEKEKGPGATMTAVKGDAEMTMMMMMTVTAETGVFLLSYDRLTVRALCSFIPGGYTGAAHRAQGTAALVAEALPPVHATETLPGALTANASLPESLAPGQFATAQSHVLLVADELMMTDSPKRSTRCDQSLFLSSLLASVTASSLNSSMPKSAQ